MISLPLEESSSNDILKFFPDFINDHFYKNSKKPENKKAIENQWLKLCRAEEIRTVQ
jgi:hypothetical protein